MGRSLIGSGGLGLLPWGAMDWGLGGAWILPKVSRTLSKVLSVSKLPTITNVAFSGR